MRCPRCKTQDVYVSQRQNQKQTLSLMSLLLVKMRCHRCCNLFSAPRWSVTSREQAPPPDVHRVA